MDRDVQKGPAREALAVTTGGEELGALQAARPPLCARLGTAGFPGPQPGALPRSLLQEAPEDCSVFRPLVSDVMNSTFGGFCVSSVGKTGSSEKPRVTH